MEIYSLQDGIDHVKYLINFPKRDDSFLVVPDLIVNYGREYDCDTVYCKKHNIKATFLPREGGCFVFNKGDIIILHCDKECHKFYWAFGKFIREKLAELSISVNEDKNDIMIGNTKFCGSTVVDTKDKDYTIYICCISINTDYDLINHICMKPRKKEPQGLGKYGITTEMVLQWYREFLWKRV